MDIDLPTGDHSSGPAAAPGAAAAVAALSEMAAAAHSLSDIAVLMCPQDAALPVAGPCSRRHRDCMLLLQEMHPARNALVLAQAGDWSLMQERAQTPWAATHAASAPAQQGLQIAGVCAELMCCPADGATSAMQGLHGVQDGCAGVAAAWGSRLARRGEDGFCLEASLEDCDEGMGVGLFGREPVSSSYTAEAGVSYSVAELLLQRQLSRAWGRAGAAGMRALHGVQDMQEMRQHGGGVRDVLGGERIVSSSRSWMQYPRHVLSSLANVLLLAGPAPFCVGGGAAGAADRLSYLGSICRAEAFRQSSMLVVGRASRRAPVFEHYLSRRLHNLATQPHLLHVLAELVQAAGA
jgi:hypothetical protein